MTEQTDWQRIAEQLAEALEGILTFGRRHPGQCRVVGMSKRDEWINDLLRKRRDERKANGR